MNPIEAHASIVPVEKETQVSIRLEDELVAEAEAIAARAGLKRAAILRMAIVQGLPAVKETFSNYPQTSRPKGRR